MVDKDLMGQKKKEYIEEQDRIYDELLKSLEKDIDEKIYGANNKGCDCCEKTIEVPSFYRLLSYSNGKYDCEKEETCWKDFFSEFLMPYVNNGFVVNAHHQHGNPYSAFSNWLGYYLIRISWDSMNQNSEGKLTFTESSYSEARAKTENESMI